MSRYCCNETLAALRARHVEGGEEQLQAGKGTLIVSGYCCDPCPVGQGCSGS